MLPKDCPVCKKQALWHDESYIFCLSCSTYRRPLTFFEKPLAWASTRLWWIRAPIFLWFIILLFDNWKNNMYALYRGSNVFSFFDLGIHELGHAIFSPFGDFVHILGGSLFQCLFPIMAIFGFLQIKWRFAAAMCWCWLGLNLFDVATYAADARARVLPLAGGLGSIGVEQGDDTAYNQGHDWYQMLSRTHHLNSDLAIAHGLRVAASTAFFIGFLLGGRLLLAMIIGSMTKKPEPVAA